MGSMSSAWFPVYLNLSCWMCQMFSSIMAGKDKKHHVMQMLKNDCQEKYPNVIVKSWVDEYHAKWQQELDNAINRIWTPNDQCYYLYFVSSCFYCLHNSLVFFHIFNFLIPGFWYRKRLAAMTVFKYSRLIKLMY